MKKELEEKLDEEDAIELTPEEEEKMQKKMHAPD